MTTTQAERDNIDTRATRLLQDYHANAAITQLANELDISRERALASVARVTRKQRKKSTNLTHFLSVRLSESDNQRLADLTAMVGDRAEAVRLALREKHERDF
jgi:hypothetical protein